jgi:hypothetical protein
MDIIETHNLGGQLYGTKHIGLAKVQAIRQVCDEMSGTSSMVTMNTPITETTNIAPIAISCFDNMKSRKIMLEGWKKAEDRKLFIDGRMSAEGFQIYTVQPGEEEEYEKTLFEDSEVPDAPCSFKATSHTGAMIGSYITAIVTNFITNQKLGAFVREVPKKLEMQLPLLMQF